MKGNLAEAKQDCWHYFVGDIHGCYDVYMRLEEKIYRHAARNEVQPLIVSVGDLVDRGPHSMKVVHHFRQGAEAGTHLAVVGNHEALFLSMIFEYGPDKAVQLEAPPWLVPLAEQYKQDADKVQICWEEYREMYRQMWLEQGGRETLESFGCDPDDTDSWEIASKELSYLCALPVYWEDEQYIVSHALATKEDLETVRQYQKDHTNGRRAAYQYASHQLMWRREPPGAPPDPMRLHISGHTPLKRVQRRSRLKILQLDTGCVYGDRLTAWCGEANHYIRIPHVES